MTVHLTRSTVQNAGTTPRKTHRWRAARTVLAFLGALAVLVGLSACGERETSADSKKDPAYVVATQLRTVNAASNLGAATNAEVLSARLYPGVYTPGPAGQMIPNTDLVTTQVLPGPQRQVVYTLSGNANFSDGQPITCTDYLLAATAGMMPDLFDAHAPLAQNIAAVECVPGAKRFTVVFHEGHGVRWRYLFGAGEVMPAHVVAQQAGMSMEQLGNLLLRRDAEALRPVAEAWTQAFLLDDATRATTIPSSGSYRVENIGAQGQVGLVRNPAYYGDPPAMDRLVLWPAGSDITALAKHRNVIAVDTLDGDTSWVDRDDPRNSYRVEEQPGLLTDTLLLSTKGVFDSAEHRQAFAACIDYREVTRAARLGEGQVPVTHPLHVVPASDPNQSKLADIGQRWLEVDTQRAEALRGKTIRVSYQQPSERYRRMVAALAQSCQKAGINVVDVSVSNPDIGVGERYAATYDAVLRPVSPQTEYGNLRITDNLVLQERDAEIALWNDAWAIPLTAQPRTFVIDQRASNVHSYTGLAGIGWNMDRWYK